MILTNSFDASLLENKQLDSFSPKRKRVKQEYKELLSRNKISKYEEMKKHFTSSIFFNREKNRYANILALESSRVKLEGLHNDYINANYIQAKGTNDCYISTQAPLPNTSRDFWKMVWDKKTAVIMMLTNFQEGGKIKSHKYWNSRSRTVAFKYKMSETLKKEEITLVVKLESITELQRGILHIFSLVCGDEIRRIYHIQYKDWNDHKKPSEPKDIKILINYMDCFKSIGEFVGLDGPPIIHCSAGIGRTGTFIACAISNHCYLRKIPVEITDIVKNLRNCRRGMVQTDEQYAFIYHYNETLPTFYLSKYIV